MARDDVDMTAVRRDARLIQALANRTSALVEADPVGPHLAAWVADIDRGIDPSVVVRLPEQARELSQSPRSRGRRVLGVTGATVLALAVSAGAAAAVTGDPLTVVKAPLTAIRTIIPFAGDDRSEAPASAAAETSQLLADARRAIAEGDLELATELLEQVEAAGGAASDRLDQLTDRLSEVARGPEGKGPEGKDSAKGKGPEGKDPAQGKGPEGKDPAQGKGPEGKDPAKDPAKGKSPEGKDREAEAPARGKDPEGKGSQPERGKNGKSDPASDPAPAKGLPSSGQGGQPTDVAPGQRGQAKPDRGTPAGD